MIVECDCARCGGKAPADVPWRGYRVLWRVWIGIAALLALLSPIIAADLIFMIPTTTLFLFGGSTLRQMTLLQPSCRRCGATVDLPAHPAG